MRHESAVWLRIDVQRLAKTCGTIEIERLLAKACSCGTRLFPSVRFCHAEGTASVQMVDFRSEPGLAVTKREGAPVDGLERNEAATQCESQRHGRQNERPKRAHFPENGG